MRERAKGIETCKWRRHSQESPTHCMCIIMWLGVKKKREWKGEEERREEKGQLHMICGLLSDSFSQRRHPRVG